MLDLKKIRDYYDSIYYAQPDTCYTRSEEAYSIFLDYLQVQQGRLLLDVSCGAGRSCRAAEKMGIRTFGIDLSFVAAKLAHIAAPGSRFVLGNAEELPFPDKHFDYIVNLGSLEHYLRPEVALAEMSRVCKDDGRLCIMVPNSRYLFGLIRSRKERFHYDGTGQIYEKMATFTEWRAMLKSSGLTVLRVYRDKEPLDTTWKNVFRTPNPRHILNKIVEKFLQAYMPLGLGYQFVFICQKESVRT